MDDLLIGYVLGALSGEETAAIKRRLEQDPALRERLEVVRRAVCPLQGDLADQETPQDLADRTCQWVREQHKHTADPE